MKVYPRLPGIAWPVKKTPRFKNKRTESASGREVRVAFAQYPRYDFELTYAYLLQDHLDELAGFFESVGGGFAEFFYDNGLGDNACDRAGFGVGDGATTRFELFRSTGGQFAQPVGGSFGVRTAYVNGAAAAATFSDDDNTLTFDASPAAGAVLTWSGNYYYRCTFAADSAEYDQFMSQLYEWQTVKLTSVLPEAIA